MLMPNNANAIQCQIYHSECKESKQQEEKLGKFTVEGKGGCRQKRTKAVPRDALNLFVHLKV